jgi:hypothetical protein
VSSTRARADFQAPGDAFPSWGLEPETGFNTLAVNQWRGCEEGVMGIDSESDTAANLVIGPTSLGMVRIFVEAEGIDLPMDFEPDEALEIAEELRAAAERARAMRAGSGGGNRGGSGQTAGKPPRGTRDRGGRRD